MPSISVATDIKNTDIRSSSSSYSSSFGTTVTSSTTSLCLSLKRKRPPMIEIPRVLQEIHTEKFIFHEKTVGDQPLCFDELEVGVFSMKGKKKVMEDTHKIVSSLNGESRKGFFGVYDGHGGTKAVEFVAENLHGNIFEMLDKCGGHMEKEDAIKAAYLKTDQDFVKQGLGSGTCCVTALIEGGDILVSNLGDCRAVLCRDGMAEVLTKDHRAEQEDERKRVENKGGYVDIHRGAWRVHGILSVSRSIGDVHLKEWVMAEPETKILHLTPDMEFLVLASDGLWEKVDSQEAVAIATRNCLAANKQRSNVLWKEDDGESDCDNVSPPSKVRRISRVKQQKVKNHSQSKENVLWKEDDEESDCDNVSPPSKVHRISRVKQQKVKNHSQSKENVLWKEDDEESDCDNVSPPSKVHRISRVKQQIVKNHSQRKENVLWKEDDEESDCDNVCPPSKVHRISRVKQQKVKNHSQSKENGGYKKSNLRKDENESNGEDLSPSQLQRISLIKQQKMKICLQNQENNHYQQRPTSSGLMAACKELVDLAVNRGIIGKMQDPIGIPACFSSGEKPTDDPAAVTRSGQSVFVSVYRTKIAGQCHLITITWCKNLLLHGLSVSVEGPEGESHYSCKVELKPWYFWRKQGSKRFMVEGKPVDVFWDLKTAKFNGETEPQSDYYVAVVCEEEVVLLLGDLKKDAYRKTGSRPALMEPILVSKKEHIFAKKKFSTRVKFHEKGRFHEISIECNNLYHHGSSNSSSNNSSGNGGLDPEMEIKIDGHLAIHVKHLQWKFRGNECISMSKFRVEVYWDVHDWLFSPGLRHALFIFRPVSLSTSPSSTSISLSPPLSSLTSTPLSSQTASSSSVEGYNASGSSGFCLFLYAWKVE
ncbi:uncharacterized protein LOC122672049 [Telopea speciosissima]|uniref:uncharacterized protein LOC122672049 n=1 Tax=Telopea speciosissima TaxID=54955 RepID=UPI001CC6DD6E|nr:uncharacterized protein LOC122672049 [Telopea speciosissima]